MDLVGRDRWAVEELGAWLRDWRLLSGVSQRRVAYMAGIDQGGLSRVERGLSRISSVRLARLIVVLDWLTGGGDPRGPWYAATYAPEDRGRELASRIPTVVRRPLVGRKPTYAPSVIEDERGQPRERTFPPGESVLAWARSVAHT